MDLISESVAKLLLERGIQYEAHGDHVRIPLPSDFEEIECGELEDGDTILGLVDSSWHTHGEALIPDYGKISLQQWWGLSMLFCRGC